MCGIAGFWDAEGSPGGDAQACIARMIQTLRHRGPDDEGVWVDHEAGIALGLRRLAVVDLSCEGHQPMFSASGRYVVVFNGEIYNFAELRPQLPGPFRGSSDTEVMLAAFERWGIEDSLRRFNGMFAFALWDRQERCLYLSRDRLGEKPLYYGWLGKVFVFGSELKAVRAHPAFAASIDRDVLALFFRHNYVPAPYSIYQGIYKLLPGTVLRMSSGERQVTPAPVAYWSARAAAEQGTKNPFSGSEREAVEQLDLLLADSVRLRMIADVPLGAFLSGGIDSSTIVALMQAQATGRVKTFSIGSHDRPYNEADYAAAVAQELGTEHTELYVTADEAMAVIPRMPFLYDEPFADSSQIPTYLVSQLARQKVTVSLSGDGGDEVFGGYTRYLWGQRIWNFVSSKPGFVKQAGLRAITAVSPETWNRVFSAARPILPRGLRRSLPGDKFHKLAAIMRTTDPETMYRELVSIRGDALALAPGARALPTTLSTREEWLADPDILQKMMYLDTVTYLPDDILVKLDRASMGVSLEARAPFLDHRVVEFAWSLPIEWKVRSGQGKWLLRQVLDKYVSKKLLDRPKWGFGVPIHSWLRGPLRDWAETLIEPSRLRREGYLNPEMVQQNWRQHLSQHHNWGEAMWGVLMFQSWLEGERTDRAHSRP